MHTVRAELKKIDKYNRLIFQYLDPDSLNTRARLGVIEKRHPGKSPTRADGFVAHLTKDWFAYRGADRVTDILYIVGSRVEIEFDAVPYNFSGTEGWTIRVASFKFL